MSRGDPAQDAELPRLSNGAIGAISKSTPKNQLLESIRLAAAGKRVVSPEVESALNDEEPLPHLSPRQREILVTSGYKRPAQGEDGIVAVGLIPAKDHRRGLLQLNAP